MFIVLRPITAKIRTCEQATNHKKINVLACGLVFSHPIGFFLATQQHSRNISGVDGFSGLTGSVHLLRFFFVSTPALLIIVSLTDGNSLFICSASAIKLTMPVQTQRSVNHFGIEVADSVTWQGWEPGGEYTQQIVLKNVQIKTQKLQYK